MNYDSWSIPGYLHFQFNGSKLQFALYGNSPIDRHLDSVTFTVNTWHHVAAVYSKSGKTLRWYVNGVLRETDTFTTTMALAPGVRVRLGSWDVQGRFLDGQLDEFRIWNVARTQSEIQGSMASEITAPAAGLVGRWGCNEDAGTTVADASGASSSGAIAGSNWSWAAGSSFTPPAPPAPPADPSGLTATANGASAVDLAWTDNAGNETGAWISALQAEAERRAKAALPQMKLGAFGQRRGSSELAR